MEEEEGPPGRCPGELNSLFTALSASAAPCSSNGMDMKPIDLCSNRSVPQQSRLPRSLALHGGEGASQPGPTGSATRAGGFMSAGMTAYMCMCPVVENMKQGTGFMYSGIYFNPVYYV